LVEFPRRPLTGATIGFEKESGPPPDAAPGEGEAESVLLLDSS